MRKLRTRATLASAAVVAAVVGMLVLSAAGGASLSPATGSMTLRAGSATLGVGTEAKTVGVPAKLPKADIEIAIDTTGSMGATIADAKADASALVAAVQAQVSDAKFAVVQFKDFCTPTAPVSGLGCSLPGGSVYPGDYPEYQVKQSLTSSAASVQAAINSLGADGGGDGAEAGNSVFQNSYSPSVGGPLGWRADSRKFVIVLSDAQPHGAGAAGFAGCTDTSADPHGLNTATQLAGMNTAKRTLLMIRQISGSTSTSLACYQSLAAASFSGGAAVNHGGDLAAEIVNLINAAFANVNDLHLQVASVSPAPASASWISFAPSSRGPIPAPSTQSFSLTATVPAGTPAGSYAFDIVAIADGVDIGHQALTINVAQKQLTLTPATASNPIGTSQSFTAKVFDVLGPYAGDSVSFSVGSGPDAGQSAAVATDAAGNAAFTIDNTPPAPGTDALTAADGALSASSTAIWTNSAPSCSAVKLDLTQLWPPNHKLVRVTASGATDSDIGDSATLLVTGVTQDELVNGLGDGDTAPDAVLTSPASSSAWVRAERSGLGDGRVYRVAFTATDMHGATCSGYRTVSVAHDQGKGSVAVDSALPSYDSTIG